MRAVQCKHPSKSEYRTVKLIDPVKVKGKHYAVAVDIYDERTSDIFMSFLNVLSRNDKVTLITFGNHSRVLDISMKHWEMDDVKSMLNRKETGLNIIVGLRTLEQIESDEHIIITAGFHDSAPWNVESKVKIKLFSPGSSTSENYCKGQTFVMEWDVLYFPKNGPHERLIRSVLDIKPLRYMNIVLRGLDKQSEDILLPAVPYGGCRVVQLPYAVQTKVHYMTIDGVYDEVECEFQDDDTIPYTSDYMKPCAMFE